jgi:hypothetical protein
MQVVVPSVSRAAVLQGRAGTGRSFGAMPVVTPGAGLAAPCLDAGGPVTVVPGGGLSIEVVPLGPAAVTPLSVLWAEAPMLENKRAERTADAVTRLRVNMTSLQNLLKDEAFCCSSDG